MAYFEQSSNIVISGHFYYDGSTHSGQTPDSQGQQFWFMRAHFVRCFSFNKYTALNSIHRIAQKGTVFNEYSATTGRLMLPILSKDLLVNITGVIIGAASRPASVSCSFDLMWRLSLLRNHPNAGFAGYEHDIPIAEIVTRNSCACARISRHGFVHLTSRFFQDASVSDTPGATSTITINTTIGRFNCYEIEDRAFVHFDSSTRAAEIAEIVKDQDLDHILRVARGQYLMMDNATFSRAEWRTEEAEQIPACAAGNYFSLSSAIIYMPQEKVAMWTLLRNFGQIVATCPLQFVDTLRMSRSFSNLVAAQQSPDFDMDAVDTDRPAEALAQIVYICRLLLQASPTAMKYECKCPIYCASQYTQCCT